MTTEEVEFLLGTDLFRAAPSEARSSLLAAMTRKTVEAGKRFIRQGDEGNEFFIIQSGYCVVRVERAGKCHSVSRCGRGDLVGEMAIVTGENRMAHVDAETDMSLWGMTRIEFDQMCVAYPVLREFITEIVTNRLSIAEFTPQRRIGKYILTDVLGFGGWSIVYKGVHSSLHLPVAIKMMKHNLAMDLDFIQKFQNEAKIIAQLNHDNIVRVHDIENSYRTVFIVMEYLEGVSLEDVLDQVNKLPFPRALDLLIQAAHGLRYAHSQGIVHQDVKPDNIFVQRDDRVKILDFGLAGSTGAVDIGMPGTPYYMAPEQIEGNPVDERTDVYSLGITAFEIVTGRRPFQTKLIKDLFQAHMEKPLPDPRFLTPDLPAEFAEFIFRAAQKKPESRFQNMGQALEELQRIADHYLPDKRVSDADARKMMSLLMRYHAEREDELTGMVESFKLQVRCLGADVKVTDFKDC
jgi:CRP-like cAMP-binding protein